MNRLKFYSYCLPLATPTACTARPPRSRKATERMKFKILSRLSDLIKFVVTEWMKLRFCQGCQQKRPKDGQSINGDLTASILLLLLPSLMSLTAGTLQCPDGADTVDSGPHQAWPWHWSPLPWPQGCSPQTRSSQHLLLQIRDDVTDESSPPLPWVWSEVPWPPPPPPAAPCDQAARLTHQTRGLKAYMNRGCWQWPLLLWGWDRSILVQPRPNAGRDVGAPPREGEDDRPQGGHDVSAPHKQEKMIAPAPA